MKGEKGKAPAIQWYYKDWLSDRQLQRARASTRGAWMNLLMYMVDCSSDKSNCNAGRLEYLTIREICSLGNCTESEAWEFIEDAIEYQFCTIELDKNRTFHIMSRRLSTDAEKRDKWRKQKANQRKGKDGKNSKSDDVREVSTPSPPVSPIPTPIPTPTAGIKEDSILTDTVGSEKPKNCPYQKIIQLYHDALPQLPTLSEATKDLKTQIRARWKEHQSLDWWQWYFNEIKTRPFLLGKNDRGWTATLHWLTGPKNMTKVLNGNYQNRAKKDNPEPTTYAQHQDAERRQMAQAALKYVRRKHGTANGTDSAGGIDSDQQLLPAPENNG